MLDRTDHALSFIAWFNQFTVNKETNKKCVKLVSDSLGTTINSKTFSSNCTIDDFYM